MRVIKASGEFERFNSKKVYRGILRAGGSRQLARDTITELKTKVKDGIATTKILDIILTVLKREPDVAARYDLKRAVMSLGPHGFAFEVYFSQILKEHGFEAKTSNMIKGKKIMQEVDIIATKKYAYMIECKYHNKTGNYTGLKEAMYTYARFLDVKKKKLNYSWLATNTHCSNKAIMYSKGVGQKITSWGYPKKGNLKDLIERKGLYPITIVKYVSPEVKEQLYKAKIMLAKDLIKYPAKELSEKTGISEKIINKILTEVREICGTTRK
ncbi:hypothetical protein KAR91_76590 [Candidatus Pacearchaeota archaeon]|nr:hypothetical protein [Candidatus Pacearchaeota archaeon]